ncbi:L-lactate permease [Vibrio mimicus]|uniref:L-lactate permease n=1 Tax=Vibrio mimicus TaxID=674 RepID=UPI0012ACFFD0|nr:L-lactate permease [Vibrio mimicus]
MSASLLLQISPVGVVLLAILAFKRPPVQAAILGVLLVLALWVAGWADPLNDAIAWAITKDTSVLFLSMASVIVPGLAFVILVEKLGAPKAIGEWVKDLGWSPSAQVIFVVLGLAPLLESMTGFGVSLIATVPLLMGLFGREIGLRIALCGMVVMPWGTLGLATLIGGLLSGQTGNELGSHSAILSGPVFLVLTGVALWLAGNRSLKAWGVMFAVACIFVGVLYSVSLATGPEIAGVMAGVTVCVIGLLWSYLSTGNLAKWPRQAWPYLLLLGIIIVARLVFLVTHADSAFIVAGESVSWKPLSSPGVALAIVALVMAVAKFGTEGASIGAVELWNRAKKPVLTIFFFLLLSQIMVKAGFLYQTQQSLLSLSDFTLAPMIAFVAGLAGYVTGSNVGGNTLVMPSIQLLVEQSGPWLAAIVNSAAGHGALGSLSILSMIIGLAGASREEEHKLVQFGFVLVVVNITLIAVVSGLVLFIVK